MVDGVAVLSWIKALQAVYAENKQYLTDLDAAIGDADHGINLDRGFTRVVQELDKNKPPDISGILKTVAMVLIKTVGGAAGPLYGTFFLRAGAACAGKEEGPCLRLCGYPCGCAQSHGTGTAKNIFWMKYLK